MRKPAQGSRTRLAERLLQSLREETGVNIGRSASAERHDDAHRLAWIRLGRRARAKYAKYYRHQRVLSAANKFPHEFLLVPN